MKDIIDIIDFIERKQKENKDFQRCQYLIFFDEIFSVIQKNERNSVVLTRIVNFLAQLRKRGIIFVSTAQIWSEIPIQYRKLCRFAIDCHMFNVPLVDFAISTNKIMDGYNAKWDNDLQDFVAPTIQTNVFKCNKEITEQYDTYEVISYKRR